MQKIQIGVSWASVQSALVMLFDLRALNSDGGDVKLFFKGRF